MLIQSLVFSSFALLATFAVNTSPSARNSALFASSAVNEIA